MHQLTQSLEAQNPEEILTSLGFTPAPTQMDDSKIPHRFLQKSQLKGIDFDVNQCSYLEREPFTSLLNISNVSEYS